MAAVKLDPRCGVRPEKIAALQAEIARLSLDLNAVDEQFVAGGGSGGQKVNKTASCVVLRYPPLDLVVRNQATRQRALNRFLALRELVDQAAERLDPGSSARARRIAKRRKAKARNQRRARRSQR